jgi:peptidoglycan/LPS O-acetylase OafA/YrhL
MGISEQGTVTEPSGQQPGSLPQVSGSITTGRRWMAHFSRETSSGRFIPEMDGLRFVAIGMVVLFHLNGYLSMKSPAYYAYPQTGWLAQAASVGFRGVELFFAISGFILGLPFAAHHLKGTPPVKLRKYYLRRLTRLEPPYFVALLVFFGLALVAQGKSAGAFYPHLAASLVYLHGLIYGAASPVMGVAWSLEVEIQFYILVPLLTVLFAVRNRLARRLVFLVVIAAVLGLQSLFLHNNPRAALSILAYLQYFLVGFLLADIFLADWGENPRRAIYWDLAALLGWPLLFIVLRSPALTHWLFPGLILVLYCAGFRGRWVNRILVNPWITAVGGMCYSIYLIHYQVLSAVGRFSKRITEGSPYWFHLSAQALLGGFAVVISSGVYFVLLEKPCMRRDWPLRAWAFVKRRVVPPRQETGSPDPNRAKAFFR